MAATTIQVYQLVPAAALFDLKDQLQDAVLGKKVFVDQKDKVFTVSQSCGWLAYSDYTALWQNTSSDALTEIKE